MTTASKRQHQDHHHHHHRRRSLSSFLVSSFTRTKSTTITPGCSDPVCMDTPSSSSVMKDSNHSKNDTSPSVGGNVSSSFRGWVSRSSSTSNRSYKDTGTKSTRQCNHSIAVEEAVTDNSIHTDDTDNNNNHVISRNRESNDTKVGSTITTNNNNEETSLVLLQEGPSTTSSSSDATSIKRRSAINTTKTADTSSTNSSSVSWGTIEFRTYETVLGDNPSTTSGPPVSIGWMILSSSDHIPIDDYEIYRDDTMIRQRDMLLIPRMERENRLLEFGYSRNEMKQRETELEVIKKSRIHNSRHRILFDNPWYQRLFAGTK